MQFFPVDDCNGFQGGKIDRGNAFVSFIILPKGKVFAKLFYSG